MIQDGLVRRLASYGIAGCVIVVLATAAYPFVRARLGFGAAAARGYSAGEPIDVPETIFAGAPHTLLLFATSRCGVCQREQPALKRIVASLGDPPRIGVAMIAGTDDPEADRAYARALGLPDRAVTLLDLTRLRVALVPAIVVVNRRGQVEYVHTGAPSPEAEEALARAVLSLAPDR